MVALHDEDGDGEGFAGEGDSGRFRRGCGSFGCVGGVEHQSQERCDAAMGRTRRRGRRRRGAKRDLRTLLRLCCTSSNALLLLCDCCPCVTCRASPRTRRTRSQHYSGTSRVVPRSAHESPSVTPSSFPHHEAGATRTWTWTTPRGELEGMGNGALPARWMGGEGRVGPCACASACRCAAAQRAQHVTLWPAHASFSLRRFIAVSTCTTACAQTRTSRPTPTALHPFPS
jgi:hypothetical protein